MLRAETGNVIVQDSGVNHAAHTFRLPPLCILTGDCAGVMCNIHHDLIYPHYNRAEYICKQKIPENSLCNKYPVHFRRIAL